MWPLFMRNCSLQDHSRGVLFALSQVPLWGYDATSMHFAKSEMVHIGLQPNK